MIMFLSAPAINITSDYENVTKTDWLKIGLLYNRLSACELQFYI